MDFDDEARKLWVRLNLDPSIITGGQYNAMDALWQHPETRAVFYVGNQTAATNLSLLQKHGVTHVVNCTDSMPNYHENYPSGIKYHRFDISSFHRRVKSDADAARFVQPMLDFVSQRLRTFAINAKWAKWVADQLRFCAGGWQECHGALFGWCPQSRDHRCLGWQSFSLDVNPRVRTKCVCVCVCVCGKLVERGVRHKGRMSKSL